MNGLKTLNDTEGHTAGDDALVTLALCFVRSLKARQFAYRIGGDEFVIVCRKTSQAETMKLIKRIENAVDETEYKCAIGYSFSEDGEKSVDEMIRESDAMMYAVKERYYEQNGTA